MYDVQVVSASVLFELPVRLKRLRSRIYEPAILSDIGVMHWE